jgi:enamine deaminase RidA (YjgF/YER057c/UK114 family)
VERSSSVEAINPKELAPPRGYSHGMLGNGTMLFVAGQIGWDATSRIVSNDFVAQFSRALDNVLAVVRAAGGGPDSIARLTIYLVDKGEYRARARDVGTAYRERMGRHFPAMSLVEVKSLLENQARVEIEATALL